MFWKFVRDFLEDTRMGGYYYYLVSEIMGRILGILKYQDKSSVQKVILCAIEFLNVLKAECECKNFAEPGNYLHVI